MQRARYALRNACAIRPTSTRPCDNAINYTFCLIISLKRYDTYPASTSRQIKRSASFFHGAATPASLAPRMTGPVRRRGILRLLETDFKESGHHTEERTNFGEFLRIPDDTPRRREQARDTIAVGFAADRTRGRETCGTAAETAAAGISWLLHRHWVKGEQNREIIDFHFFRSLSLSHSLCLSLSAIPFSLALPFPLSLAI